MPQTEIFDFCTAMKYAALGKRVSMVSWFQGTYVYFDSENELILMTSSRRCGFYTLCRDDVLSQWEFYTGGKNANN